MGSQLVGSPQVTSIVCEEEEECLQYLTGVSGQRVK